MSNRKVIDKEEFIRCVKRNFTLSDTKLAHCLKVGRTSVWRFKRDNPDVVEECQEWLDSLSEDDVSPKNMSLEVFSGLLPIRKWDNAMKARRVSTSRKDGWIRTLFNVCKHLDVTPGKLTIEQAARLVNEMKSAYYEDRPQIKGLYYSSLRDAIRGFFMSVHNMSGQYMKNLGIGTEALKGSGKYARQKVSKKVRHGFEEILVCKMRETGEIAYFEAFGNSLFNFSTATRISASLAFSFRTREYSLKKDKWVFEIFDKGKPGQQIRWSKIIMGSLLEKFKKYCSMRFDIPVEDLETDLPLKADHLFPSFIDEKGNTDDKKIRNIVKPTLISAGLPYKDFPPTHIWRHTFAQEALEACGYNYELVASIGGWKNTRVLKDHYGEMGETAREKGLLKMMGAKIPEAKFILEW